MLQRQQTYQILSVKKDGQKILCRIMHQNLVDFNLQILDHIFKLSLPKLGDSAHAG